MKNTVKRRIKIFKKHKGYLLPTAILTSPVTAHYAGVLYERRKGSGESQYVFSLTKVHYSLILARLTIGYAHPLPANTVIVKQERLPLGVHERRLNRLLNPATYAPLER